MYVAKKQITAGNTDYNIYFFVIAVAIAESILNVGALISLIGALCSTALALVFPPVLELILALAESECPSSEGTSTDAQPTRMSIFVWVKNILILVLALFIFITGTVESLDAIRHLE